MSIFTSLKVAIGLFALFVCILIPSTLSLKLASALAIPIKIIAALLFLILVLCTLRKLKSLRTATLLIHLGTIVILLGSLISSLGFVATVNVYEGDSTDTAFRWDVQEDTELGFDLSVVTIHREYHPVAVKVGVLKNGMKTALYVTRTGDSFSFEHYLIQVRSFDPSAKVLKLSIHDRNGKLIGTYFTAGRNDLPPDFPLDFKLVAFKDPQLKRIWVDLELRKNGEMIAAGTSEVNQPFVWQGQRFFTTEVNTDPFGRPYAGIQISRDPGVPYLYAGFIIFCLGLVFLARNLYKGSARSRKSHA